MKQIVKKAVQNKAFEELQKLKESHSKVQKLKYKQLEMQKYLKPSNLKIKKEDAITIFKLRSRVEDVKINFRGKYEELECELCKEEDESQEHILKCKEILKTMDTNEIPEYENLFEKNVTKQLEIARMFNENMKRKKKLLDK